MRLTMNGEFHDIKVANMFRDMQLNGTRVVVYQDDVSAMREWCLVHCKKLHVDSYDETLIDDATYERSRRISSGEIADPRDNMDGNWVEARISDALAREIQRDIDREILRQLGCRVPQAFFWFEDRDEALLFKLTWGGE